MITRPTDIVHSGSGEHNGHEGPQRKCSHTRWGCATQSVTTESHIGKQLVVNSTRENLCTNSTRGSTVEFHELYEGTPWSFTNSTRTLQNSTKTLRGLSPCIFYTLLLGRAYIDSGADPIPSCCYRDLEACHCLAQLHSFAVVWFSSIQLLTIS